jgi:hypothetical protein
LGGKDIEMVRRFQPTTVGNMAIDVNGGYVSHDDYNELAKLVRECLKALDELLEKRPMQAAMLCGSTTLGNLRVDLNGAVNRMSPYNTQEKNT